MKNQVQDTFHATELYLLSSAFHAHNLFGLPDRKAYQFRGAELFEKANNELIDKKILSKDGKITEGGAYVIKALEYYYKSNEYVRINNFMFAFSGKEKEEIIILVELDSEAYRLLVMSKVKVLKLLLDHFQLLLREPGEGEREYFKRKLSSAERKELEKEGIGESLINLESFHINEGKMDRYEQWLIFENKNRLIMIDTSENVYYQASQYWLLQVLFEEMDFPYREGDLTYVN